MLMRIRRHPARHGLTAILLAAAVVAAGTAKAVTMSPSVTIDVGMSSFDAMDMSTWDSATGNINDPVSNGNGSTTMSGDMSLENMWNFGWMMTFETDPFVTLVIDITNTSTGTMTFGVNSATPVSPAISPTSIMDGTMNGTVTDSNGSGSATLGTFSSFAMYEALIDGTGVQQLAPSGSSLTCGSGGGCSGSFLFPLTFGPTGGPAVAGNIGINNIFTLTPGDTVHLESFFQVTAVPVPAAVWLFGSGLLGLAGVARRKTA